jgi:hypothetical protein
VGLCTMGAQDNWNAVLPLTDPDDLDGSKSLSFLGKERATRWLVLEMNVAITENEVRRETCLVSAIAIDGIAHQANLVWSAMSRQLIMQRMF